ncbi:PLD nuclease N-terminal domain-containing protein [Sinomonas gamaensis]|uniref:PLD nuclease N-terminal domain-containing protein n=1 Tax=Sinomonas gamaensis TaxID=2565624 RepID=UPI001BB122EC|nr:PLD nuclease N-terminal domain-containing protein [Sinomonas gamaensis]
MDPSTIPVWIIAAVVLLALVQVTLVVVALVDLYRRPIAELTFGNKVVWAAVIILLNILGPILYFAAGRRRPPADDAAAAAPSVNPRDVADALYRRPEKGSGP